MGLPSIALILFVTCSEIQLVYNQYWNGYGSCDPYTYGYGQPYYTQPGYTDACSEFGYDYQPSYNPYRSEQPIVIIVEDRDGDNGWEWMDVLNVISSVRNEPNGPVNIPYPVPMSNCGRDYSEDGCLDCVCKNRGCGCSHKCEDYDTCDNGCNCNCGCRNQEKSRSKSNSGKHSSDTNCGCKKNVILHKSECCCRS